MAARLILPYNGFVSIDELMHHLVPALLHPHRKGGNALRPIITASRIRGAFPNKALAVVGCVCALVLAGITTPSNLLAQTSPTSGAPPSNSSVPAADLRQQARDYLAKGDYDKAIECFTILVAQNPPDVLILKADLGLCYKFKRDYAKAMPLFAEVGAVPGPRQAQVLFWTEDCYCEQGKLDSAIATLTKAYTTCPDARIHVLTRRAARYEQNGQFKEAIADLRERIAAYPNDKMTKGCLIRIAGLLYRASGQTAEFTGALQTAYATAASKSASPEEAKSLKTELGNACLAIEDAMWAQDKKSEAIDWLTRMMTDQPDAKGETLIRLFVRHEALGKFKDVVADAREFVDSCPDDPSAGVFAVKAVEYAFKDSGDCPESQATLEWALKAIESPSKDPKDVKSLEDGLGTAFIRAGRFDRAEQLYKALLGIYPDDPVLTTNLALVYRGKCDYEKAMPLLSQVAMDAQDDIQLEAISRYGDCLTDQHKYEEAVAYLAAQCSQHPDYEAQLLSKRAKCLRDDLLRYDEAKADLQRIVDSHPDAPEALTADLGVANILLYCEKDTSEARARLQAFRSKHPDYPDALSVCDSVAACCYTEQRYADAAKLYEYGLGFRETGTWHPFFLYMMGDCYAHTGEVDKAISAWDRLVRKFPDNCWTPIAKGRMELLQSGGGKN